MGGGVSWRLSRLEQAEKRRVEARASLAGGAATSLLTKIGKPDIGTKPVGPGRTEDRNEAGINNSTALSRSPDSRASCASLANVGESSAACCSVTGCRRRFEEGVVMRG